MLKKYCGNNAGIVLFYKQIIRVLMLLYDVTNTDQLWVQPSELLMSSFEKDPPFFSCALKFAVLLQENEDDSVSLALGDQKWAE